MAERLYHMRGRLIGPRGQVYGEHLPQVKAAPGRAVRGGLLHPVGRAVGVGHRVLYLLHVVAGVVCDPVVLW